MLQAAQVRHSTEVDEARRKYLELHHELQHLDSALHAHYTSANVVQLQLQQVPFLTYSLLCPFAKDAIV